MTLGQKLYVLIAEIYSQDKWTSVKQLKDFTGFK